MEERSDSIECLTMKESERLKMKDTDMAALKQTSDILLINEVERRGYYVTSEEDHDGLIDDLVLNDLHKLYLDYMLTGPDFFDKELKKFFNLHLHTTIR